MSEHFSAELAQASGLASEAALADLYLSHPDAWLVAGRTLAPERRSIIFEVVTRLLFHSLVIFSIYLLLTGHNLPGGGFAGGLLAGIALAVRYLAGGRVELGAVVPGPGTVTTRTSRLSNGRLEMPPHSLCLLEE